MRSVLRIILALVAVLMILALGTWAYTGYYAWRTQLSYSCVSGEKLVDAYWATNHSLRVLTSKRLLMFNIEDLVPTGVDLPPSVSEPIGMAFDGGMCMVMCGDGELLTFRDGKFGESLLLSGGRVQYWDAFLCNDNGNYYVWTSNVEGELRICNMETKGVNVYFLGMGKVADSVVVISGLPYVNLVGSIKRLRLSNDHGKTLITESDGPIDPGFRKRQLASPRLIHAKYRGVGDDTVFIYDSHGNQVGRIYTSVPVLKWCIPQDGKRICILNADNTIVVKRPWF